MSKWDEPSDERFHYDGILNEEQESRLLRKFHDYRNIEKKEIERRKFLEASNKKKPGQWTNRFILAAIIQVAIISAITIFLVALQMMNTEMNLMQYFANSFDGPSKWFFFGYIMYMTLVVSVSVTAIFYNQIEVNMKKQFTGFRKILAGIHLFGMNVGGTLSTMFLIWYGIEGAGVTNLISNNAIILGTENNFMGDFSELILIFAGIFAVGIMSGGIAFLTTYFQKNSNFENLNSTKTFELINYKTEFERL